MSTKIQSLIRKVFIVLHSRFVIVFVNLGIIIKKKSN